MPPSPRQRQHPNFPPTPLLLLLLSTALAVCSCSLAASPHANPAVLVLGSGGHIGSHLVTPLPPRPSSALPSFPFPLSPLFITIFPLYFPLLGA